MNARDIAKSAKLWTIDNTINPKCVVKSFSSLTKSNKMKKINIMKAMTYNTLGSFNEKYFPVNPRSKSPHTIPIIASSASNINFMQ